MSSDDEILLASRGLTESITIRGFTPYPCRDRSRDTFSAVDIWDLQLRLIPKNKRFREYILYDFKQDHVPALSAGGYTVGIPKEEHYFDSEFLFLPVKLAMKHYRNIPESEVDLYRDESREEEGIFWQGAISGLAPVRELMEKAHPLLMQASHVIEEDRELTENSEYNNDPHHNRENYEIFYKPVSPADCNKWDCPICQPVEKFVEAWRNAKKRTNHYLQGLALDHPRNVKFDKLMRLKRLAQYSVLSTMLLLSLSPPHPSTSTRTLSSESGEEQNA